MSNTLTFADPRGFASNGLSVARGRSDGALHKIIDFIVSVVK